MIKQPSTYIHDSHKDNESLVKQTKTNSNLSGAGPGRAKGSKNKFTNLKQAFLDVFEQIEKESIKDNEVKSFFQWSIKNDKNRGLFYQLISKMLPSNVTMDGDMQVTIKRIITDIKPEE